MNIDFILDITPTPMHRPRVSVRNGYPHAYKDAKQKQYEDIIDFAISRRWRLINTDKLIPISEACKMDICFEFKKPKTNRTTQHQQRPDVDNLVKQVLDSLVRCKVLSDDSIIYDIHACKRWSDNDSIKIKIFS